MAIHILSNGQAAVSPNYLFSNHGTVSDPLQRQGKIPFAPRFTPVPETHGTNGGHPFFGVGTKPAIVIGSAF